MIGELCSNDLASKLKIYLNDSEKMDGPKQKLD